MIRAWGAEAPRQVTGRVGVSARRGFRGAPSIPFSPLYDSSSSADGDRDAPRTPTRARSPATSSRADRSPGTGGRGYADITGSRGGSDGLSLTPNSYSVTTHSVIAAAMNDASSLTAWGAEILSDACTTSAPEERRALLAVGTSLGCADAELWVGACAGVQHRSL